MDGNEASCILMRTQVGNKVEDNAEKESGKGE